MKKNNRLLSRLLIAGVLMLVFGGARAAAEELLFLSTQLAPVAEAHKMRTLVLKDFPGEVNFQPYDARAVFKKLASDNPQNQASLVGGTHGDLMPLYQAGVLKKLTLPDLESTFQPSLNALGRLDQYVWPYLGVDLEAGRLDLETAAELVDCFCLKFNERAQTTDELRPEARRPRSGRRRPRALPVDPP